MSLDSSTNKKSIICSASLEVKVSRFGNTDHERHGDGHGPSISLSPIRPEVHVKMDKFTHTDEMLGGESPHHEDRKWRSVV
jgi:hypothetical protein